MAQRCLPLDAIRGSIDENDLLEAMFATQEEIESLKTRVRVLKKSLKNATERCVGIGLRSSSRHRLVSYRKVTWELKEAKFKKDCPDLFNELAKVSAAKARKALDDDEEYFLVGYDHDYEVVELPESEAEDFVCEVAVR